MKTANVAKKTKLHFILMIIIVYSVAAALSPLRAQVTLGGGGAVNGTVVDQSGAAVPGATVILTEVARKLDRQTVTNQVGRFVFPSIPAAIYSLRVSKVGFETSTVSDFQVQVSAEVSLDVALKIGSTTSQVTVSGGEMALLNTESNTLGTVVGTERIEDLPLNGRNFMQLGLLAAGANSVGNAWPNNQTGRTDREIDVGGNLPQYTAILVDGIVTRHPVDGRDDGRFDLRRRPVSGPAELLHAGPRA